MSVLGRVKNLIAKTRDDVRGEQAFASEVSAELEELLSKLEAEFEEMKKSGRVTQTAVNLDAKGLPVPDSSMADYQRALQEGKAVVEKAKNEATPGTLGWDPKPEDE